METIAPNMFVALDFVLTDEDGEVLARSADEEGGLLSYVQGYGMVVPGLEAALHGLAAGDSKTIVVGPEHGYGLRDEELVFEADRAELPDPAGVEVGDELGLEVEGEEVSVYVADVHEDYVVLDGNHPLAGVTVRAVRPATEAELRDAAEGLDDAREDAAEPAPDGAPAVSVYALHRPKTS